jgi:bis(5'-nucleosidyl)-tetraphosphatase
MKNKYQANGPVKSVVKEKSCGVILYRLEDGLRIYLLLHYPSGHWDFPKGHVEEIDKNEMATAQRELEEETGIEDIEFVDGYREPMYYEFRRGKKQLIKKTVVYFAAETKEKEVKISF